MKKRKTIQRLSIDLPIDLHVSVKMKAIKQGRTIANVIRQLLKLWLAGKVKIGRRIERDATGQYYVRESVYEPEKGED